MNHEPDFLENLRAELSSWRLWIDRAVVLGYAVAAGLFVVGFTIAAEFAFGLFERLHHAAPWAVLLWTPALTAGIVWITRRWFPGAAGSGIPQIKAALDPALPPAILAHLALRPPPHQRALKALDYSATALRERTTLGRTDLEATLARLKAAPRDEALAIVRLPPL